MAWRENAALGNVSVEGTLAVAGATTVSGTLSSAGVASTAATTYAADTALGGDFPTNIVLLGTGVDITAWTPTVGASYVIYCTDSTADATVTLASGITWDGTNDKATFDTTGDYVLVTAVSATRLLVLSNPGAISFS
jgi:hypothetical protein